MKLIDILDLIPKEDEFAVELYDNNGEMFYGYIIGPKHGDRNDLEKELNCEVIGLRAGTIKSIYYDRPLPSVSIEIQHSLEIES